MKNVGLYRIAFEGTVDEVVEYLCQGDYDDFFWDCPTGREDLDGLISVLRSGLDEDVFFVQVDILGNIGFSRYDGVRVPLDSESVYSIVDFEED